MEASNKLTLKVGLFVAIGLVVLMGSIITLAGGKSFFKSSYSLVTQFKDVQGLGPGSVVSVAGLPVGNVAKIDFVGDGELVQVAMDIDKVYQNRITENSMAEVRTQGALGDKYVYIAPGEKDGRVLQDGDILPADNSAGFLEVMTEKSKDLALMADVVKELHVLLRSVNSDSKAERLMQNMVSSSHDLKLVLAETRALMKDIRGNSEKENKLRQSLVSLSSILEKVDKGEGTLGALVNDKSLHNRILSFMGESPRNQFLKPLIRDTIQTREKK